ncbi:MAG: hypothetical protein PWQ82_1865 [Thermosediminibacterales bacterium]|nr:hypothetical protein [Thermosediminibacterales bacterium]MDK2836854.1 hypothetical protein [Thermosediminibacterales bacterium]
MKEILNQILTEIHEMKSEIAGIKSVQQEMKSEQQDMKSEIKDIKLEIAGIKSTLQEHGQLLRALEHRADITGAGVTRLEEKANYLQGDITHLKRDVDDLRSDVVELKSNVARLADEQAKISENQKENAKILNTVLDSQHRQERVLEVLSLRSLESEAQIRELKRAK